MGRINIVVAVVALLFILTDGVLGVNYFASDRKIYTPGSLINTQTIKLTSIPRALPYKFYEYRGGDKLPFCQPKSLDGGCNIGECLSGIYKQSSKYEIAALNYTESFVCKVLGDKCEQTKKDYQYLIELIEWEYRAQMTLDDLPIAEEKGGKYEIGFKIGEKKDDVYHLNNHLQIEVSYDSNEKGIWILGFNVKPMSVNYPNSSLCSNTTTNLNLNELGPLVLFGNETGEAKSIVWTYGVTYIYNNHTHWDKRWDQYFKVDEKLHWVSMSYAIVTTVVLMIFLGIVLVKIVHSSPMSKYNFDDVEESGWKTLHGDVFRPPQHFMILSVLVGCGTQLLSTAFCVLLLGAVGYLSPAQSGSLNKAMVVTYPMLGFIAGYVSARVYTRLGGGRKRRNAVFTAVGFNGIIFVVWFIAEIILWSQSSSAGRVSTFFSVFALFLFVHVPLVILGSYFAHKRPVGANPVGTNTIPRMIPPAPWYSHTYLLTPLLAILPFGVAFNEIYDMMVAMWSHHVYYFFAVVLVVFVLFTIIVAEVSVILCYFQLGNENYHWWWRAFYVPAAVVIYIFLTAIFYVGTELHLKTAASVFLYLSYTSIVLMAFFVFMSSIAFYACWTFVHKIYSTLHVD